MASQLPNGEQVFLDSDGNPLGAGTVQFCIPNTDTLKNTWQDAGETILNDNPLELDAAGRAIIYGSGVYRQIVRDVFGNLVWDQLTTALGSGGQTVNAVITGGGTIAVASGIFPIVNGTSGPITIVLPGSPGQGDSVKFIDAGFNAGTYPIKLSLGANHMVGGSTSVIMTSDGEELELVWLGTPAVWAVQ